MIIKRIAETLNATFGVLIHDGVPFAVSLELPWLENRRDISCIPVGTYICKRYQSNTHGDTFRIMDVPDRGCILFHIGNRVRETKGCTLVGEKYGKLYGEDAILASGDGFREMMSYLEDVDEFTLTVKNCMV